MSSAPLGDQGKLMLSKSAFGLLLVAVFLGGTIFGFASFIVIRGTVPSEKPLSLQGSRELTTNILAVSSGGEGVTAELSVSIEPGEGHISYPLAEPFEEVDFQYSAQTAINAAADYAETSLDSVDISFKIDVGQAQIIGGPSAGAAMAVLTLAGIRNEEVMENVVITGGIRSDGGISKVGGIIPKLEAAHNAGKDLVLLPPGQSKIVGVRRITEEVAPGVSYTSYEPYMLDLNEYLDNKGWEMDMREVSTLGEAADWMIK